MTAATITDPLVIRGAALGLLASLLGTDPEPLSSGQGVAELRLALELLGNDSDEVDGDIAEMLGLLDHLDTLGPFSADDVRARQVRLFERGKVPPYELSHVPPGASSYQAVLSDVAAFYQAFGMRVSGDRPDHCVAELEFLSMTTLAEADCRERGDVEGAEVSADAARKFLRDHIGSWLPLLAARLEITDPDGPHFVLVEVAAMFVATEAQRRSVIPIRPAGIIPDWSDEELVDPYPVCGEDEDL